ncbi:MAG: FAD:protein FMN transferase [Bacteroidota bacterium]
MMWNKGVGLLILVFSFFFPTTILAQYLQRFEYTQPKMGTSVSITFYADNQVFADSIAQLAYLKIDTLNRILSDYLSNSEVNQLSQRAGSGKWIEVSDDLWAVLSFGKKVSKQSRGRFDMTIAPLSKLWRKAFRQQIFPKKEQLKAAKKLVNYKWLKLDASTQRARLKREGMRLDLGGLAKGYVVDEMVELLQSAGIQSVLVDAGGDLRITNPPPNQEGWRIQQGKAILTLQNTAIATSGSTYQYLEWKGKRYSHIIHPKKGVGIARPKSVTVQSQTCMAADAWASVLSLSKCD